MAGFRTVREDADGAVIVVAGVALVRVFGLVAPTVELVGGINDAEEAGRLGRVDAGVVVLDRKVITETGRLLVAAFFAAAEEGGCLKRVA